eukprot:3174416-Rhodomonas_salina.2
MPILGQQRTASAALKQQFWSSSLHAHCSQRPFVYGRTSMQTAPSATPRFHPPNQNPLSLSHAL